MNRLSTGAPGLSSGEVARKAVHIGIGLLALLIPWLTRWQGLAICGAAFFLNWLVLPRITHHLLEREDERRRGYSEGILEYPLSVGALFLLFGSRMPVVAAAWAILAFGDGFATIVGRTVRGPRLPWNHDKTISGFAAFVMVGGVAASAMYLWAAQAGIEESPASLGGVVALCFAAALFGAVLESLETGINDNVSVPLMSGAFLFALTHADPTTLAARSDRLLWNLEVGFVVNLIVSVLAWRARTVKPSGAIMGFVIGTFTWTFGGWQAFAILLIFFVLGSGATRVGYQQKLARKIAQEEGGRRGARHAVANCGVPAFLAFMAASTAQTDLFTIGLVAALATAVFDTVSSEIGQVYGRHPFLITTFRRVPPGTDGAVSVEGTLAGLAAAVVLAAAGLGLGMMGEAGWVGAGLAVAGAFVGTTVESYLGAATLGAVGEAISRIDNEAMNFANTLVGAMAAMALALLVLN